MFGLFRKPLVIAIVALAATNAATFWVAKHYHAEAARAVAECNADKLESALEAEQATSEALRRALSALQEIRDRERAAAESSILALRSASQRLAEQLQDKQRELNKAIRRSRDGCLFSRVPSGVWNALRGDEDGAGGGAGTDSDTPSG